MDDEHLFVSELSACAVCDDYGWVCTEHNAHSCNCGGAEKPCHCNPEAWLPDDFAAVTPADLPEVSMAAALAFEQKF